MLLGGQYRSGMMMVVRNVRMRCTAGSGRCVRRDGTLPFRDGQVGCAGRAAAGCAVSERRPGEFATCHWLGDPASGWVCGGLVRFVERYDSAADGEAMAHGKRPYSPLSTPATPVLIPAPPTHRHICARSWPLLNEHLHIKKTRAPHCLRQKSPASTHSGSCPQHLKLHPASFRPKTFVPRLILASVLSSPFTFKHARKPPIFSSTFTARSPSPSSVTEDRPPAIFP